MPARRIRDRSEEYQDRTPTRPRVERDQAQSEAEAEPFRLDFYNAVYRTVKTIPEGRVASYGTIGRLIGHPRHSRMVGAALKCLPPSMASPYLLPAPRSNSGESTASSAASSQSTIGTGLEANTPSRNYGDRPRPSSATTRNDLSDYLTGTGLGGSDLFEFPVADPASTSATRVTPNTTGATEEDEDEDEDEYVVPAPLANPDWVPWHRVVSSTGVISPRGNDRAVQRQADYLMAEGVEVKDGPRHSTGGGGGSSSRGGVDAFGLGGASGGRVSMACYGWKG